MKRYFCMLGVAALAILAVACSKTGPNEPGSDKHSQTPSNKPAGGEATNVPEPPSKRVPEKSEQFAVKGFYLGMEIRDAQRRMAQLSVKAVLHEFQDDYRMSDADDFPSGLESYFLQAGPDKHVYRIHFDGPLVDRLFKVEGISAEMFAQEFVNAYNIPSMEQKLQEDRYGNLSYTWDFISPDGYRVTIDSYKALTIDRVAKSSGFQFD